MLTTHYCVASVCLLTFSPSALFFTLTPPVLRIALGELRFICGNTFRSSACCCSVCVCVCLAKVFLRRLSQKFGQVFFMWFSCCQQFWPNFNRIVATHLFFGALVLVLLRLLFSILRFNYHDEHNWCPLLRLKFIEWPELSPPPL